jgi:hypothetical protein
MKIVIEDTFVYLYHNGMSHLKIDSCYYTMLRAVHFPATICLSHLSVFPSPVPKMQVLCFQDQIFVSLSTHQTA